MDTTLSVSIVILAAIVAFAVGYLISIKTGKQQIKAAEERAGELLSDAQNRAETLKQEKLLEVKEDLMNRKRQLDEEHGRRKEKLQTLERQLKGREESIEKNLSKKLESATRREKELLVQQKELQNKV